MKSMIFALYLLSILTVSLIPFASILLSGISPTFRIRRIAMYIHVRNNTNLTVAFKFAPAVVIDCRSDPGNGLSKSRSSNTKASTTKHSAATRTAVVRQSSVATVSKASLVPQSATSHSPFCQKAVINHHRLACH